MTKEQAPKKIKPPEGYTTKPKGRKYEIHYRTGKKKK